MVHKDDRRIFERFEVDFSTELEDPMGQENRRGQCRDISAGGISLLTEEGLVPNRNMQIWLSIPDGRDPFRGLARVIWSKRIQQDKWHSGLEFKTIDFMGLRRIFNKVTHSTDEHS